MPSTPRSGAPPPPPAVSPPRRGDVRAGEVGMPPHTPTGGGGRRRSSGGGSFAWSSPGTAAIPHTPPPPNAAAGRFAAAAAAHHSPASSTASHHPLTTPSPRDTVVAVSPAGIAHAHVHHIPHVLTSPLRLLGTPLPHSTPPPPPPPPPLHMATFDRMMSPLTPASPFTSTSTHDPRFRRRGRQPTACTECNRRKQRCDGMQPCHHCAKRNVSELCRFPEQKPTHRPTGSECGSDIGAAAFTGGHAHRHSMSTGAGSGSDDSTPELANPLFKRKSSDDCDLPSPKRPAALFQHQHMPSGDRMIAGPHSSPGPLPSPSALSDVSTMRRSGPITRPPSIQDLVHHTTTPLHIGGSGVQHTTMPVSSERVGAQTPPTPSTRSPSRPPMSCGPRSARLRDSRGGSIDDDELMQEDGARGYGSLAVEGRGDAREPHATSAPAHDHFQFYGTSHFGPRAAAQFFQQMSGSRRESRDALDVSDTQYALTSPNPGPDAGAYTLTTHIRTLDSLLPPRSLCKRYVDVFFRLANSWMDILYQDDFHDKYARFWAIRGEFEDMTRIDVRWLALFLAVLAFGALLDRSSASPNGDAETKAQSNQLFVGARAALTEAPSFGGESIDTVRAYALVRPSVYDATDTPAFTLPRHDAARARGMEHARMCRPRRRSAGVRRLAVHDWADGWFHIDGEKWKDLSPQQAELRRRLWAQMYCLDRSISYFLGRPLAIHDDKFSVRPPANMPDEELGALPRVDWPLATPTKSTFLIVHYRLAQIIGHILTTCFGLSPRKHTDVMACEHRMVEWMHALPPVFNFDEPDLAWDDEFPWLRLQRQTLISKFHQARISLHRPYLLHMGYPQSRSACVASAEAELRHRLRLLKDDAAALDRFKWMTVASGFAPASILGLLLTLNKRHDTYTAYDYPALRVLFTTYLAAEKRSLRHDPSVDCEMKVLDMMLVRADERERRRRERERERARTDNITPDANDVKPFVGTSDAQGTYTAYPPQQAHSLSHFVPPEHAHMHPGGSVTGAPSPRRSGVSVSELTHGVGVGVSGPPAAAVAAAAAVFPPYPPSSALAAAATAPAARVMDGSIMFTPAADEWLISGRPRPWEQRPPDDPSAAPFPPADDMRGWLGLLDDISLHDLEACWLGHKPVIVGDVSDADAV